MRERSRVWIVQMLCPENHCVIAHAYVHPNTPHDDASKGLQQQHEQLVAAGVYAPECATCGSTDLRIETGASQWERMAQAVPHMVEVHKAHLTAQQKRKETLH